LLCFEFGLERIPLHNPEKWAMRLTAPARFFDFFLTPITQLLIWLQGTNQQILRKLGSVSEDELKTWVEVGEPEGGLEPDERKMIYSIFQFGETLCREIMVPRMEVLALEVKTPLNQAINALVDSGHSRVPVYDDEIDNVIGVLYAKDLLKIHGNTGEKISIKKFLRPAYFVPESKKVDELLAEMQAKGTHIAVVVDEYGGMAGLVTLEDIVEEIVGEIRDEYDQGEELLVQALSPDEVLFKGRVSLDDFNDALDTHLDPESTDTLGGYFYSEMGRVPVEGDQLEVEGWKLTVEEIRGRRVGRIRAKRENNSELESA
jgi:putative hemolysin